MKNTKEWYKEYINSIKNHNYLQNIIIGNRFPIVLYRDFKSFSKKQKIITVSIFVTLIGISLKFNDISNTRLEERLLKCDCSIDLSYMSSYQTGRNYGERIPMLINTNQRLNNSEPYKRGYFTISWIKNWIYTNGSQNLGGYPEMKEFQDCWGKGFIEGRNKYFNDQEK